MTVKSVIHISLFVSVSQPLHVSVVEVFPKSIRSRCFITEVNSLRLVAA